MMRSSSSLSVFKYPRQARNKNALRELKWRGESFVFLEKSRKETLCTIGTHNLETPV